MDSVDTSRLSKHRPDDVEGTDEGEAEAHEVGDDDDVDEQVAIDHLNSYLFLLFCFKCKNSFQILNVA